MNKNLSDKDLDQILERLVKDSLLDENSINEIADSPQIWWNVQRRIKSENENRQKGWIPPWQIWRTIGFASFVLVFCGGLFWFVNSTENIAVADIEPITLPKNEIVQTIDSSKEETPQEVEKVSKPNRPISQKTASAKSVIAKKDLKREVPVKNLQVKSIPKIQNETVSKSTPKNAEVKTEFIALSYSPAPESGQILKVKVPRSMMVSLGVTSNVEKNSELVNAEVLMGDDGLARAIRFVR